MADAHLLNAVPELATDPVWLSLDAIVGVSTQVGGTLLTDDAIPETLVVVAGAGTTSVLCNRDDADDFGGDGTPAHLPGVGVTYTAPAAGGGTLATVLAAGNDPDGHDIQAANGPGFGTGAHLTVGPGGSDAAGGGGAALQGGAGELGFHGGVARLGGGSGNAGGFVGAAITAYGGQAAEPGELVIQTAGSLGVAGQVPTSDGNYTTWADLVAVLIAGGHQAAHVANGSTVDQLRDALIAAGLMAAS